MADSYVLVSIRLKPNLPGTAIMKSVKLISALCMLLGLIITITTASEEECNCGRKKDPNRIVGGTNTDADEFIFVAKLVTVPRRKLFCSSSILSSRYVITSAHCVNRYRNNEDSFGIVIEDHDTEQDDKTDGTKFYNVEKIKIHPEYNAKSNINDVAIVKSKEIFKFSMKVGPVCLPFKYTWEDFTGKTVTALGWGASSRKGSASNSLQKVDLKIIPIDNCKSQEVITKNMLCTDSGGKDVCKYDRGGPLVWKNETSKHLMHIGVISVEECGEKPSISMRTTSYLNFIESATPGYKYCKTY